MELGQAAVAWLWNGTKRLCEAREAGPLQRSWLVVSTTCS